MNAKGQPQQRTQEPDQPVELAIGERTVVIAGATRDDSAGASSKMRSGTLSAAEFLSAAMSVPTFGDCYDMFTKVRQPSSRANIVNTILAEMSSQVLILEPETIRVETTRTTVAQLSNLCGGAGETKRKADVAVGENAEAANKKRAVVKLTEDGEPAADAVAAGADQAGQQPEPSGRREVGDGSVL